MITNARDGFWRPPEIWPGQTVFIIGGGPSLEEMELYPEFKPLHSRRVIGVNDAYSLGSWVDVCFFGDYGWLQIHNKETVVKKPAYKRHAKANEKETHDGLKRFCGLLVTCCDKCRGTPGVLVTMKRPQGLCTGQGYIAWNYNSGAAAINLAVYFGATRIVLLGFDMKLSNNGRANWHVNPKNVPNGNLFEKGEKFWKGFQALKAGLDQLGTVEVLNATPGTAMDIFPKVKLEDVL